MDQPVDCRQLVMDQPAVELAFRIKATETDPLAVTAHLTADQFNDSNGQSFGHFNVLDRSAIVQAVFAPFDQ